MNKIMGNEHGVTLLPGINQALGPLHQGYIHSGELHPRRTLDQFYYYMLSNVDIDKRDRDQVVHRWVKEVNKKYNKKRMYDELIVDPKIIMVDQLWLWVLDNRMSCSPQ